MSNYGTLSLVTPPAEEPVSRAEMKQHLRVDADDTSQDQLISSLIQAAREHVELVTRRVLIQQTWTWSAASFPVNWADAYRIPSYIDRSLPYTPPIILGKPPLLSVASVKYYDLSGVLTTLDPSAYVVDPASIDGVIWPAFSSLWPIAQQRFNGVQVTFDCGYGGIEDVPEAIKAAIKLLVGDLYENREAQIVGTIVAENRAVAALLGPYRYLTAA